MHLVALLHVCCTKHMHKHKQIRLQMQTYTNKHKHVHTICTQTNTHTGTNTNRLYIYTLVQICRKVFCPFTQVCHLQDTLDNVSNQAHIIWPLLLFIKRPNKFIVNQNSWNQWPWYINQAGKWVDLCVPHQKYNCTTPT